MKEKIDKGDMLQHPALPETLYASLSKTQMFCCSPF